MTPDLETAPARPAVICEMLGGPHDGSRYQFDYLPVVLGVGSPARGAYQWTGKTTKDGARIFRFRCLRQLAAGSAR